MVIICFLFYLMSKNIQLFYSWAYLDFLHPSSYYILSSNFLSDTLHILGTLLVLHNICGGGFFPLLSLMMRYFLYQFIFCFVDYAKFWLLIMLSFDILCTFEAHGLLTDVYILVSLCQNSAIFSCRFDIWAPDNRPWETLYSDLICWRKQNEILTLWHSRI